MSLGGVGGGTNPAGETWRVIVEIPADKRGGYGDGLFEAIGDAAETATAYRSGWDPYIYGEPSDNSEQIIERLERAWDTERAENDALRAVVEGLRTQLATSDAGLRSASKLIGQMEEDAETLHAANAALQVRVDAVKALLEETMRAYWKNPSGAALVTVGDVRAALESRLG